MGTKNALKKLALAVAVPGVAFGTLAGVAAAPAMASTAQAHAHYPVYERISGYSNGLTNSIAVQVTGGFFDNGFVSVGLESGLGANVYLTQGTQTITLTPTNLTGKMHQATCSEDVRIDADLAITGGTGAYAGLTGTGTAVLTGSISVPHVFGGGCSTISISNLGSLNVHLDLVATAKLSPAI